MLDPVDQASSSRAKLGGWLIRPATRGLQARLDPDTYGGGYLLGLRGLVVIAHGSSSRIAIANATRMAARGVDVRHRVRRRWVRTPADLARDTLSPGGSIYGSSSHGPTAAFLRPANRSPVPGLFLVGGSSHPGGGLPLVTLSAKIVADLVGPA